MGIEAVAHRCSVKKVFLKISKIHRKTPVPESLFNNVADLGKWSTRIISIAGVL